jgi:tRNA1Val (adenine37-N6)-methyltransferase
MTSLDSTDVTHDTLLRGRVSLFQPARGFRSSLDPVLLAAFVAPPFGRFVDIGCGAGALSFLLLAHDPEARGVGVEIQGRLATLAGRGATANGFTERFQVRNADVRRGGLGGDFDLVVTNPPFRPLGTGVLPPDEERAIANHEVRLRLAEWLLAAAGMLAPEGRLAAIFPASRWNELLAGLGRLALRPCRLRPVLARAGQAPQRLLVEARRTQQPLRIEPPLVIHSGERYSPEMRALLGD